jgi:isoleucyl-tRNA synthetase
MEEAWLERYPGGDSSVHLREFPRLPDQWTDEKLEARWEQIREVRKVVTGALEIARRDKVIGASLEAAPRVFIADAELAAAVRGTDMAEISITSAIEITEADGPADAFRLDEVQGVAVVFQKAEGNRCARSWRILPEVGTDPEYPDLSLRDAQAMRELKAAGN